LVTIIVGIATVVAINTFGSAADSANVDSVRQDLATIAASAQGFYMKPTMLGGGGRTFEGITFDNLAFPGTITNNGLTASNENGVYTIPAVGANAQTFLVTAIPASEADDATEIKIAVCPNNAQMGILDGPDPDCAPAGEGEGEG
ncbi:MAG: hypothetical protein EA412_00135, partial [Chitinophagaceae bacterium]